jgi:hypothetical protein
MVVHVFFHIGFTEVIQMQEDHQYSVVYQIGGTIVCVVSPKITEEERLERLKEIQHQIWIIWIGLMNNL